LVGSSLYAVYCCSSNLARAEYRSGLNVRATMHKVRSGAPDDDDDDDDDDGVDDDGVSR